MQHAVAEQLPAPESSAHASLPTGWVLTRTKFVAAVNPVKSEVASLPPDTLVQFLPMESVSELGALERTQTRSLEAVYGGYTYMRDGDVIVAKITPCFENGKGAYLARLEGGIGFGSSEFHVLRPRYVDGRFLWYCTFSHAYRHMGRVDMSGAAGQQRVPESFVANYRLCLPSLTHQRTINRFLDRETARIDTLIKKKQRLIELLKEKRQAVVTNAVTRGLDPTASMKDSGVEWIGKVPAHWQVARVKHAASLVTSGPRGWSDFVTDEGDIFFQSGDLTDEGGVDIENAARVTTQKGAESERAQVARDDVLICITGAKTGRVGIVGSLPIPAYINQHLALVRHIPSVAAGAWIAAFLRSVPGQSGFEMAQYGLKQGLALDDVKNATLPIPPLDEQQQILRFLDKELMRLGSLLNLTGASVELLRERRSALITAAVTGQIDVRDAA